MWPNKVLFVRRSGAIGIALNYPSMLLIQSPPDGQVVRTRVPLFTKQYKLGSDSLKLGM